MTAYAAGLRVSELVPPQTQRHPSRAYDDPRGTGQGEKRRYTILSQRLLVELRRYKQAYQPVLWSSW